MTPFRINFLDHVAIMVKDMEVSAQWYQKVLGLQKYELPEWGAYPIFLLAGKSGIALFPANANVEENKSERNIRIDHYAFNVSRDAFDKAVIWYEELGLKHTIKDHHHFLSVYIHDPDGHTVELTTLVGEESSFYKSEDN